MRRLISILNGLDRSHTNYSAIYAGASAQTKTGFLTGDAAARLGNDADFDPVYWKDDVSYALARSHKLTPDKPVVTVGLDRKSVV